MAHLAEYLVSGDISAAELSRRTGIKPPTLSKIKHLKFKPSMEMVLRCYVATGGEVTVRDTLPELAGLMDRVALQVVDELERKANRHDQHQEERRSPGP